MTIFLKIGKIFVNDMKGEELESLSCAELVEHLLAGISDAFGVLYTRYFSFIRNCCSKIVSSTDMGEELAQTAFVKALEQIQFFKPDGGTKSFKRWIWKISFRLSLDHLRSCSRERKALLIALEKSFNTRGEDLNPGKVAQNREYRDVLLEAVIELPELTRNCFVGHYLLRLKIIDICAALSLSKHQVDHQLLIARRIIGKRLGGLL